MNMKKIYKAVARKYGVSVEEVEREMQSAIDIAYRNPNADALNVSCHDSKPTLEEFITYAVKNLTSTKEA